MKYNINKINDNEAEVDFTEISDLEIQALSSARSSINKEYIVNILSDREVVILRFKYVDKSWPEFLKFYRETLSSLKFNEKSKASRFSPPPPLPYGTKVKVTYWGRSFTGYIVGVSRAKGTEIYGFYDYLVTRTDGSIQGGGYDGYSTAVINSYEVKVIQ